MDAKLLEFSRALRQNGVRVSPAEDLDAVAAVRVVGLRDRESLRAALRSSMAKSAADIATFDKVFDLFFLGSGTALTTSAGAPSSLDGAGDSVEAMLEQLKRWLDEHHPELSSFARDWLEGDQGRIGVELQRALDQLRAASGQEAPSEADFVQGIGRAVGFGDVLRQLENLRDGMDAEDAGALRAYIEQRIRALGQLLKQVAREEVEKRDVHRKDTDRLAGLGEKSFSYLTEEDMRRMKEAVTRLAERLRNVVAVRKRRSSRGRFDIQATLRRNLQYGCVPFRIVFDDRHKEKPQIVVLCDVSDSVRNASRFMLQFVYGLQDLYSRVRSFIFVAEPGEITRLFEEHEVGQAIDLALRGEIINVFAHSDFGRTFQVFQRDFLTSVNARTTVIVLGDARNNYNLAHEWALGEIRRRAKQLIWLNPESRMTWGFGDSEMDRYRPFCDVVEECRNLNQLYRIVDRIVIA